MNKEIPLTEKIRSAKDAGRIASQYRKMQDLTQADIAGLGNTGIRFISDFENGKGTVQFDKVLHILDLLGMDIVIIKRVL